MGKEKDSGEAKNSPVDIGKGPKGVLGIAAKRECERDSERPVQEEKNLGRERRKRKRRGMITIT